jgi:hypothetical protein
LADHRQLLHSTVLHGLGCCRSFVSPTHEVLPRLRIRSGSSVDLSVRNTVRQWLVRSILLAVVGVGVPALGSPVGASAAPCAPQATDQAAALAMAQRCGIRVEALFARTETTAEVVNPNGTSTIELYAYPQWRRRIARRAWMARPSPTSAGRAPRAPAYRPCQRLATRRRRRSPTARRWCRTAAGEARDSLPPHGF